MTDFGIRVCEKYSTGCNIPSVIFVDKTTKQFVNLTGWNSEAWEIFNNKRFKVYYDEYNKPYVKYKRSLMNHLYFNEYDEEEDIEDGGNISSPELNEVSLHPETPPLYEEQENPPSYSFEPEPEPQGRDYKKRFRDLMKDYQELEGQYDDVAEKKQTTTRNNKRFTA